MRELFHYDEPSVNGSRPGFSASDRLGPAVTPGFEVKLDRFRRKAALRAFPELEGKTDDEITSVVGGLPELVTKGAYRFSSQTDLPTLLRDYRSWFGGKTSFEIAREFGHKDHTVSSHIRRLLAYVREGFEWEEIATGQLLHTAEDLAREREQQELDRKRQRIAERGRLTLRLAYPEANVDEYDFDSVDLVYRVLAKVAPSNGRVVYRNVQGETMTSIGNELGITLEGARQRRERLMRRWGRNIPFKEFDEARKSEDPENELEQLFERLYGSGETSSEAA